MLVIKCPWITTGNLKYSKFGRTGSPRYTSYGRIGLAFVGDGTRADTKPTRSYTT